MNCIILFPKAITGTFDEMFSADLLVVKNKIYKQFDGSDFWGKKQAKTTVQSFKNTLKHCIMVTVFFSQKIKSPHGWGQSHLKTDIQRFVLSTEPFLRDIFGPRYFKNNSGLSVNH